MKKLLLVFAVAFTLCPTAMASDIAISTQAGWMSQGAADTGSQEIVNNVKGVSVQVFTPTQLDALEMWVKDHTGDGTPDLLIMFGNFPATIYPAGNAQPDGSIAELFLDDGNVIINTGDYIFYVGSNGNNDAGGLQNMMDVSGAAMWGDDSLATIFTPTADGQLYTPSLPAGPSNRPWFPAQFAGTNWEVELILAQNSDGSQVHPAILHNTVTGGRLGIFFQWNSDAPPRGQVISEWINHWYLTFVASGNPYARRPDPKKDALVAQTWVSLAWEPGDFAVSHDLYVGENFADVNTGAASTFRGNQPTPMFFIGLGFPGDPYPAGLVPGTTYYWRVDEVNTADPNSPWKGPVWNFTVPPQKAYNPAPVDGSRFIDAATATLSWSAGFGAKLHTVYFGDNRDTVANATTGIPQGSTTYKPAGLQPAKTYYWRVDEFDAVKTYKGDVWSFTTGKTGGGVIGQYYKGMNFETLVLTRTDPKIDFNWGDPGGPDPAVGNDQFSARWTGEVEAAFTETYTFYASADDGVRLWVDGVQLVNAWVDQGTTEYSGKLDLVAGNTYNFVMEYYENGGGAVAQLRWSSPRTPKQIIPSAALSPPLKASSPSPANGATGVSQNPLLRWNAGVTAASHDVYFGNDPNAVKNATKTSPEYKGTQTLGAVTYAPANLGWATAYYWRIDEVNAPNPGSPWVGNVWSFTTADYGIVDDFEYYNDIAAGQPGSNLVYMTWLDGFGTTTNGSTMGYPTGSSLETANVHGGGKAVPLIYNNSTASFSEVERTLASQNWTDHGIQTLSLWFRGDATNVPGQLYVKINGVKVPYDGDAANLKKPIWQPWNITLASVGTNLQSVTKLAIGIETKGTTGTVLLDDIRLYPLPRQLVTPVQPDPNGLAARFALEGNVNDGVGGHNGTANGGPTYGAGKIGQAIVLDGVDDYVVIGSVGISGTAPRTIAGWAKVSALTWSSWIDVFGFTGPSGNNGHFDIELVGDTSTTTLGWYGLHVYGWERNILPADSEWHHLAATYDGTTIKWYGDGLLVGSADRVLNTPDNVHIGKRQDNTNFFQGSVDEVQIFSRVLSEAEIAGLASRTLPFDKPF